MAIKTFTAGSVLTASDTNTYLANSGLVYVGGGSVTSGPSVSINNCFTATYDNYRILLYNFQPATAGQSLNLRMRAGGVDASGADYNFALSGIYVDGSQSATYLAGGTAGQTGMYNSATTLALCSATIDIFNPAKAERTFMNAAASLYNSIFGHRGGIIEHNLATAYDGITFLPSSGNFLNLQYKIYGYRQA